MKKTNKEWLKHILDEITLPILYLILIFFIFETIYKLYQ